VNGNNSKTSAIVVMLDGTAWWQTEPGDPIMIPMDSRPGWSLINPGCYPRLKLEEEDLRYGVYVVPHNNAEALVIATNALVFESPVRDWKDDGAFFVSHDLPLILRQLRYVSGYAHFPLKFMSAGFRELQKGEMSFQEWPSEPASAAIGRFNLQASLTADNIKMFVDLPADYTPPVYAELLLDTIEALSSFDFKKSILYAAIAVETMAATLLDEEYERLRSASESDHKYRFINRQSRSEFPAKMDPVYKAMMKGRRSQLKPLLDEIPLYILGRSLLTDTKELCDSMIELHKERSKIVHSGDADLPESGLRASHDWIAAKIRDVVKVFEWFGLDGKFAVLDQTVYLGPEES
jgi:hypothetical protein